MSRCRQLHDNFLWTQCALVMPVLEEIHKNHHWGFVYAGFSECGLIKVGMTHQQCPFCRMEQNNLSPQGLVFSENVWFWEQEVIRVLGVPCRGREWFTEPQGRLEWLVERNMIHKLIDVELSLAMEFG